MQRITQQGNTAGLAHCQTIALRGMARQGEG
jgi:hypothetical protein